MEGVNRDAALRPISLADRTVEEDGNTVTTTVRCDYHWQECGRVLALHAGAVGADVSRGTITVIEVFPAQRVES